MTRAASGRRGAAGRKPERVDLRRLDPEHIAAIEFICRELGCRSASAAIRFALLRTARALGAGEPERKRR